MTLFDWIKEILYRKRAWSSFTESDHKTFSIYMVNRFLSMKSEWIDVVNELQCIGNNSIKGITPELTYNLYIDIFPRTSNTFIPYIKGKKKSDISKKEDRAITKIMNVYDISRREAKYYYDILK